MMAAAASIPALEWHAAQDAPAMLQHNRQLTSLIIQAVDDLDFALLTPRPESERGSSIMLQLPERLPAQTVLSQLKANNLIADARGQILRLSPGILTTTAATEKLIEELKLLR